MKKYVLMMMSCMALVLAACGGGGSSSESSSGDRFSGGQTITTLGESENAPFVMTIDGNTVTVVDEDFTASGELNGNNFTVNVPAFSFTEDGITCTFNIAYSGSLISETMTSGSISGSVSCDGIDFPVTGTFSANR